MSAIGERYRTRADAFQTLIDDLQPDQWRRPSPCEGWLVTDVVAHVVDFSAHVLRERAQIAVPTELGGSEDPAAAFRVTREHVQRVLDDPQTPAAIVGYLDGALSFDLPQHWWDIAIATGHDATIDPDEVERLWTTLSSLPPSWWDWHHANGWYAPPIPVPDDASLQDQVLGLIGRDPAWRP